MISYGKAAAAGFLVACIISFTSPGAYEHYRFKVHGDQKLTEIQAVRETIKLFSASMAGFYATGYMAGLVQFPADNLVRRRIFQDIRNWEQTGKMLVMDRDKSTVREVKFIAPGLAVALVDENWFSVYQDRATRRQISGKKANFIVVRYYLKKQWGRWIVIEYEVHQQGEQIPPVPVDKALKWQ